MKKYYFEAAKKQWEKPTEPKAVFCPPAKVCVLAETEAEALALAKEELRRAYLGTGILLGEVKLAQVFDLAVDWNYGYGDARGAGTSEEKAALARECTK